MSLFAPRALTAGWVSRTEQKALEELRRRPLHAAALAVVPPVIGVSFPYVQTGILAGPLLAYCCYLFALTSSRTPIPWRRTFPAPIAHGIPSHAQPLTGLTGGGSLER